MKILLSFSSIVFLASLSNAGVTGSHIKKNPKWDNVPQKLSYQNMTDGMWVTKSGTVTKSGPSGFQMDSGSKMVLVEMDDWDNFKEGNYIKVGDRVTVHGEVDNDFFERRKIEADRVMVQNINTIFYANSTDEEDFPEWHDRFMEQQPSMNMKNNGKQVAKTGRVIKIRDEYFVMKTDNKQYKVSVDEMPYNPLDKKGHVKVKLGDTVSVMGELDRNIFTKDEIEADYMVTLKMTDQHSMK